MAKQFRAYPVEQIPKGVCVVFLGDKVIYAGPIKKADAGKGHVQEGSIMLLNPADFTLINAWYKAN